MNHLNEIYKITVDLYCNEIIQHNKQALYWELEFYKYPDNQNSFEIDSAIFKAQHNALSAKKFHNTMANKAIEALENLYHNENEVKFDLYITRSCYARIRELAKYYFYLKTISSDHEDYKQVKSEIDRLNSILLNHHNLTQTEINDYKKFLDYSLEDTI